MAGRKTDENLIPLDKRTKEEQREIAKMGGKASGVARREKKTMAQTLDMFLSMPLKNGKLVNIDELRSFAKLEDKNISVQEAIILKQTIMALHGDPRSAAFIRDLMRETEAKTEDAGVTIIDDFK